MWDDEPGRPVWKGIGGAPGRRRYQRRTAKNGEELSPPRTAQPEQQFVRRVRPLCVQGHNSGSHAPCTKLIITDVRFVPYSNHRHVQNLNAQSIVLSQRGARSSLGKSAFRPMPSTRPFPHAPLPAVPFREGSSMPSFLGWFCCHGKQRDRYRWCSCSFLSFVVLRAGTKARRSVVNMSDPCPLYPQKRTSGLKRGITSSARSALSPRPLNPPAQGERFWRARALPPCHRSQTCQTAPP